MYVDGTIGSNTSANSHRRRGERHWLSCLRSSQTDCYREDHRLEMEFCGADVLSPSDVRNQSEYHHVLVQDERLSSENKVFFACLWLNIGYTVATTLGNTLQCNPVQYTWLRPEMDQYDADGRVTVAGGTCINSRTFVLSSCALSIFMDLIIIPIPSLMVWNLQMSVKTKTLVVLVMSFGWVATGVSVGRFIVYYYRFAPTNLDRTWDIGIVISIAEPAVHIMTACAPATKGLFRMLFPSFDSEYPTYEERYDPYTPSSAKFGSRATASKQRASAGFNFGLSTKGAEEGQDVVITERERGSPRGEDVYGMKPLGSVDSREHIGHDDYEPTHETRASKANTEHSRGDSDITEAEPKHALGHAK
ncbi:hypothetical protein OPT61_g7308 [Boeremia exigua]|uniref:Uncharacterized protein n=1 Tax=Boeremia exigua TaxID=749465 RepID=A0ACC2I309_9PLEO|nr:hypothetical protein OPT61_g7308 [Boeremia exigua]